MKPKNGIRYSLPNPKQKSYTYPEFYKEYRKPILLNAYRYTRQMQDAEDVMQECMLRVLTYWNTIEQKTILAAVSMYCTQVHTNWLKVDKKHGDVRSFDDIFDPDQDYNHPADPFSDPYYAILRDQSSKCMESHLKALTDIDRDLFIMVYGDGYKTVDAAKQLGITKGNADLRLHRSRKKMLECITPEEILETL